MVYCFSRLVVLTVVVPQLKPKLTTPPQIHLGRVRRYPDIGECTLPLRVLVVVCTMRNEALRNVTELLRNVMQPLRKTSILPITN